MLGSTGVQPEAKHIDTNWVVNWEECVGWKARFVAREYRTQEWWLDDLFAASSHPMVSRVVDHLYVKLNCRGSPSTRPLFVCMYLRMNPSRLVHRASGSRIARLWGCPVLLSGE